MVPRAALWVITVVALAFLSSVLPWSSLPTTDAQEAWMPPPKEKRCPSKWGADGERGAANLLTPPKVLEATKLIKEGKVYELGRVLEAGIPTFGVRPMQSRIPSLPILGIIGYPFYMSSCVVARRRPCRLPDS